VTSEEFAPIAGAAHGISPVTGMLTSHYTPRKSHRSLRALWQDGEDYREHSSSQFQKAPARTRHFVRDRLTEGHVLLTHDEETDMTGYRILILIAAIVITGCEALVFVGTTAVN
jgi:hypothetical protein